MTAYENDVLIIPEKYKEMSISELEKEKAKVLKISHVSEGMKKAEKSNRNNIVFKFWVILSNISVGETSEHQSDGWCFLNRKVWFGFFKICCGDRIYFMIE